MGSTEWTILIFNLGPFIFAGFLISFLYYRHNREQVKQFLERNRFTIPGSIAGIVGLVTASILWNFWSWLLVLLVGPVAGLLLSAIIYQAPSLAVFLLVLFRKRKSGEIRYTRTDYYSHDSRSHSPKVTYYKAFEPIGVYRQILAISIFATYTVAIIVVSLVVYLHGPA